MYVAISSEIDFPVIFHPEKARELGLVQMEEINKDWGRITIGCRLGGQGWTSLRW